MPHSPCAATNAICPSGPQAGIVSKTPWYRVLYTFAGPVYPALKRFFPGHVTTTEELGQAMLHVLKRGFSERVLENRDIVAVAAAAS